MIPTRIELMVALVAGLAGCATGGHPTPDAIFRHPVTGDVQWCDKGSAVGAAVGGLLVAGVQGAAYSDCKTALEGKGYVRLNRTTKLSSEDQQRYEADLERMNQARADSIRKK